MANNDILSDLDNYDREMLKILSQDGRITVTELSERIGLSKSPCQVRLKRLQQEGFITGFRAVLNAVKLDVQHIAFVEVKLTDTTEQALAKFNVAVRAIPAIEECHMIAGRFDYLLKVRTRDINDYRRVLAEHISTLPNVANTSTYVAMQAVKENGV